MKWRRRRKKTGAGCVCGGGEGAMGGERGVYRGVSLTRLERGVKLERAGGAVALGLSALERPSLPASVQNAHVFMPVDSERPPQPGRKQHFARVVNDDGLVCANALFLHRSSKDVERGKLNRRVILQVHYIPGPVDKDCARYVSGQKVITQRLVLGVHPPAARVPLAHLSANVEHNQIAVRLVELVLQPLGADESACPPVTLRRLLRARAGGCRKRERTRKPAGTHAARARKPGRSGTCM